MVVRVETNWPVKRGEFQNAMMDSTVWNDFKFRNDDVIIATWAKAGTTWMQQIVGQLVFDGAAKVNAQKLSPWVDFRLNSDQAFVDLEAQQNRRYMKTHLPADALVISPLAKYIYIARDGRDAVWSFFNHQANFSEDRFKAINDAWGDAGPKFERGAGDIRRFYRDWLDRDGYPAWPFWHHVRSWWEIRQAPNVKLIHFNELKRDLEGNVRTIAEFLGMEKSERILRKVTRHCTFDWMKAHSELVTPGGGTSWTGGADTFIYKGTNGRWRDVLSAGEVAAYEARALAELGPECAAWLAGENVAAGGMK